MERDFEFTTDWFSRFAPVWSQIIDSHKPTRLLEIGAYEGRSTCFLIERCGAYADVEVDSIDTWAGGVEHDREAMSAVEARFDANVALAGSRAAHKVTHRKHKALSGPALAQLIAEGKAAAFDLIYVDGSHQAPDVLTDAVLSFQLLKVGGVLIFDDYLWSMESAGRQDFYNMPKPAIDAFVNIFQRKLAVFGAPLYQLYLRKIAD